MSLTTGIQHRLYLKQVEFWKMPSFDEILPVNFNYQNLIMVCSGTVEENGQTVVFQTYSCGCGPQPLIRGALLLEELAWQESEFRRLLGKSDNPKDLALVDQDILKKVQRLRRAQSVEEKGLVVRALQGCFGENKKISFF